MIARHELSFNSEKVKVTLSWRIQCFDAIINFVMQVKMNVKLLAAQKKMLKWIKKQLSNMFLEMYLKRGCVFSAFRHEVSLPCLTFNLIRGAC